MLIVAQKDISLLRLRLAKVAACVALSFFFESRDDIFLPQLSYR